ncbi:GGDEF domain-containing protein [Ferrovum sp.]|uniref:GGDEF domain-containing protein n=1 Tax=Ferrovum sp. TaxID=2609467 RepID=UPI00261329D2|nr:GGDEF domain-containing protein [Ferrovum sp.]
MASEPTPAELAGKTLKALVARKLSPTPENYVRLYAEISGKETFRPAAPSSGVIAGSSTVPSSSWAALIRDLLRQIDLPHKGMTLSRKKEGVNTVLMRFGNDSDLLYEKMQGLILSWGRAGSISEEVAEVVENSPRIPPVVPGIPGQPVASGMDTAIDPVVMKHLRDLLAQTLESNKLLQPELGEEINALVTQIRAAVDGDQVTDVAKKLRHFWVKMELRGGDKVKIQEGLLSLLRLLVENVGELVADDKWLHGQISILRDIMEQPLDKRSIADAEKNLRDALVKQSSLKQSLADAKDTLKSLMTSFIDRMGEMTESTGDYQAKIEGYNLKIGLADNLTELGHILEDLMQDTRVIQASTLRSHEELVVARRQAVEAQEKIRLLEQELEQVSELVREDQLTGALNRRGMEDVLQREITRADRTQSPLCISLLDIDNFKLFNDLLGHKAGDLALMHVSETIKTALRPTDAVARYGGEEFLLVLPATHIHEGVDILQRLQRLLTQKLFVHDGEEIIITFSAGVAMRGLNETAEEVIGRADQAMYQAKAAGKNRVVKAES